MDVHLGKGRTSATAEMTATKVTAHTCGKKIVGIWTGTMY